ncbi:MAG: hypothetical protein AAGC64_12255 [Bacteroidota bacterium]
MIVSCSEEDEEIGPAKRDNLERTVHESSLQYVDEPVEQERDVEEERDNTSVCTLNATSVARLFFLENGGTKKFYVALTEITYYNIIDNRSWISTSKSGGVVTVTCNDFTGNPNTANDSDKIGTITVIGNTGCEDTITVYRNIPISDPGPNRDCDKEGC